MRRLLLVPVVLIALAGLALAWSGTAAEPRADFAFVNRGDINTLDLNAMSYQQDIRIADALWEGLYTLDPQTLQPILGSADSVKLSPDRRVYTLHIRPDARWSNGDPLLAKDFLFEWRRMIESPREYTYLHDYIRGAEAYEKAYEHFAADPARAPRPDFGSVGEKALDDHTLQVTLERPVPFFPALLAFAPFFPCTSRACGRSPRPTPRPATSRTSRSSLARRTWSRTARSASPNGSSSARCGWSPMSTTGTTPTYAAGRSTRSTPTTPRRRIGCTRRGAVDWLADVDAELAAPLHDRGRTDLHIFKAFGTYYYEFNCQPSLPDGSKNPLADARVRRALAMAIDKEQIVRDVTRLRQPVARTFIPPGVFRGYHSPPGLPYDPAAARAELAAAGYPGGRGFPRLSVLYNTEGQHADIATCCGGNGRSNSASPSTAGGWS